jgi:hypothetical protein
MSDVASTDLFTTTVAEAEAAVEAARTALGTETLRIGPAETALAAAEKALLDADALTADFEGLAAAKLGAQARLAALNVRVERAQGSLFSARKQLDDARRAEQEVRLRALDDELSDHVATLHIHFVRQATELIAPLLEQHRKLKAARDAIFCRLNPGMAHLLTPTAWSEVEGDAASVFAGLGAALQQAGVHERVSLEALRRSNDLAEALERDRPEFERKAREAADARAEREAKAGSRIPDVSPLR